MRCFGLIGGHHIYLGRARYDRLISKLIANNPGRIVPAVGVSTEGALVDVRREVASRLKRELDRKALRPSSVAADANVCLDVLNAYIDGRRELRFEELRPICAAIGLPVMRLLAPRFAEAQLQYRGAKPEDRARASDIENAFLLLAEFLPDTRHFAAPVIVDHEQDFGMLLAEVNAAVEGLRTTYPSVEELYAAAKLPVLAVNAGNDGFDAFLMRVGAKSVVCVNLNKPNVRIHFSLLHEIAHFLYHRNRDVPVDSLKFDLYDENISEESRPEYVANKFAQMYLIPFADAQSKAMKWKQLADVGAYLSEHRTAPGVLTNAIYDHLRLRYANPPKYLEVQAAVTLAAGQFDGPTSIRGFVQASSATLCKHVCESRDQFSEEVWEGVAAAWGIKCE